MKSLIKRILGEHINISITHADNENRIKDFIQYTTNDLGLSSEPDVIIQDDRNGIKTTAYYLPNKHRVVVYGKNRHVVDVLRSIAHEMVHAKQLEDGRITEPKKQTETGSPIENEANSLAGVLIRNYGNINPEIYE